MSFPDGPLPPLASLSIRPVQVTWSPAEVRRRLAGDGVVSLNGRWAESGRGSAILAGDPIRVVEDAADPFGALDDAGPDTLPLAQADFPVGTVGGGWFGWLAYSGARSRWAYYPNVLRYDARTGRWFDEALIGIIEPAELERRRVDLLRRVNATPSPASTTGPRVGSFTSSVSRAGYEAAVRAAIEHIRAGDIYQANLCLALCADVTGSTSALYERLVAGLAPAFGAYLETATTTVASASPERFLRRIGREVRSSPIKGTRPRSDDRRAARRTADDLLGSAKDRAENVMIVDMVRNDLARVAETGTVRVPDLLRIEPHPGVWHLVSDVTATLCAGVSDADLLRATFPPGSVTGTPKVRALTIIDELEAGPRGVYTGAIGFQSPVAGLELSVAIRTLEISDGTARLGVGAGITTGSVPTEEWWECFDKGAPIVAALGSAIEVPGSGR